MPLAVRLEMAKGFTHYMVRAVMSGRGDVSGEATKQRRCHSRRARDLTAAGVLDRSN
jgi:hypothetical protein